MNELSSFNGSKRISSAKRNVSEKDLELALALTDSSRRGIIELLNDNPRGMTAKELADSLYLTIPTIMSHLKRLLESGAIICRRRTGKQVGRALNRYYSLIQFGTAEKIEETVEIAKDHFSDYLISAILSFLVENSRFVPTTNDPYFLVEWLETLIRETCDQVATSSIFNCNNILVKAEQYRELGVQTAKAMLFNDFMFLLNDYVCDLFAKNPRLVNEIGRHFNRTRIRSEMDILFIAEAMYSLLYDSDEIVTKAKNVLLETIGALPEHQSLQLRRLWPLVINARSLPEKTKDKIPSFFLFGDDSEMLRRCERNALIITKLGGTPHAERGPKV